MVTAGPDGPAPRSILIPRLPEGGKAVGGALGKLIGVLLLLATAGVAGVQGVLTHADETPPAATERE